MLLTKQQRFEALTNASTAVGSIRHLVIIRKGASVLGMFVCTVTVAKGTLCC